MGKENVKNVAMKIFTVIEFAAVFAMAAVIIVTAFIV